MSSTQVTSKEDNFITFQCDAVCRVPANETESKMCCPIGCECCQLLE